MYQRADNRVECSEHRQNDGKCILFFGISYFVRLGAFRDMPHFVRRDIFAFGKAILRPWRSGILFAHTTAAGNITRRSRISLPQAIELAARRIELKKHLRMQVLSLAVANHYDATLIFEKTILFTFLKKDIFVNTLRLTKLLDEISLW